jgi:hypothetical protein
MQDTLSQTWSDILLRIGMMSRTMKGTTSMASRSMIEDNDSIAP